MHRENESQLADRLKIAIDEVGDGDKVLEIGVGTGEFIRNIGLYKKVYLCAIDISSEAIGGIKEHLEDSQLADISNEKLKFEDNVFDTVICLEVFEHLQNPYYALSEIQRVLKPNGKLLLSIPNYLGGHLMIYPGLMTLNFFQLFLRQNFFKITKLYFWGPVLNKDNAGKLIEQKLNNKVISLICLRLIQVMVRFIQTITKLLFLRISVLYWSYIFVCKNNKNMMGESVWMRQLEQTSGLKDNKGWYHRGYHRKC